MSIIGTFNGWNIVSLPCDTLTGVESPSAIEWDDHEVVAQSSSPFTGQTQVYDWQQSWMEAQVSFAPMVRWSADAWAAFLSEVRGPLNVFLLGDPKAARPKGSAPGAPVVSGAGQTGYSLVTRGWTASQPNILLFGDWISIGYRMYRVVDIASSDSSGDATLSIWPPLRESPADGAVIQTRNCKGLFRLKNSSGNKRSTNVGSYGLAGFAIREAI